MRKKILTTITTAAMVFGAAASAQFAESELALGDPLLRFGEVAAPAAATERGAQEARAEHGATCDSLTDAKEVYLHAAGTDAQVEAGNALAEARGACEAIKLAEAEAARMREFVDQAMIDYLEPHLAHFDAVEKHDGTLTTQSDQIAELEQQVTNMVQVMYPLLVQLCENLGQKYDENCALLTDSPQTTSLDQFLGVETPEM